MKIAILSDIHSNYNSLVTVLNDISKSKIDCIIMLGDLIDYGPRHNEVVNYFFDLLNEFKYHYCIKGNHEKALFDNDLSKFSSDRGRDSLNLTKELLSDESKSKLKLLNESGSTVKINGLNILLLHGSLSDLYWGNIDFNNLENEYFNYDLVLNGHSHKPHQIIVKNTLFINPGSVGQPRNNRSEAQYSIYDTDTKSVIHNYLEYDINDEIKYFDDRQHEYYKSRLFLGI